MKPHVNRALIILAVMGAMAFAATVFALSHKPAAVMMPPLHVMVPHG